MKQIEKIEQKMITIENAIQKVVTWDFKNGLLMLQLLDKKYEILKDTHKKLVKMCRYTLIHSK